MSRGERPEAKRPRLLVFVIAYYAEASLERVLDRIPRAILSDYDCEILVVDDASQDRTFEIGHDYRRRHPELRLTVLRNEYNQGYGGNQKVGYAYAAAEGYDFVAMVHGDGQYAPEELPRLVRPLVEGTADAVFGSRMIARFGALRGGMPLYKYVGNKILTRAQNLLLGTRLSEFHSGYRVYRVATLRRTQYLLNTNDFHFDTEIILQLLNLGARILELPIPTYYGDEISRVNGMRYAKDVMLATLRNAAHRSGVLYQRRYDPLPTAEAANLHYDLKLGYDSSHQWAVDAVPAGARVADLGAGPGRLSESLLAKGCEVTVLDCEPLIGHDPRVHVHRQDLDVPLKVDLSGADHVLLLDVLEHLKEPEAFLDHLRRQFDARPRRLILSVPNVAFLPQRLMLFFGEFNYGKAGVLDRTHTRLFTFRSARRILLDAGFRIRSVRGVPAPFPKAFGDNALSHAAVAANRALIGLSKTLFSYQVFIEADSTPDVDFVLERARRSADAIQESSTPAPQAMRANADGTLSSE
jgi:glycosyltransferase involved in cell wall biosynthesis